MEVPVVLKGVKQYIKRAEDVEKESTNPDATTIAFWCRQYAVDKCEPYIQDDTVKDFFFKLLDIQDANKSKAGDKAMGQSACETHAMMIFDSADNEDRSGNSSKQTANLFYQASTFLEVCDQFEELKGNEEIEGKRKYAKWKSADIIKALKEGRKPQIGDGTGTTFGNDNSSNSNNNNMDVANDNNQLPDVPQRNTYNNNNNNNQFDNMKASPPSAPPMTGSVSASVSIGTVHHQQHSTVIVQKGTGQGAPPKTPTDPRVIDAIELAHFAISSLKYARIDDAKEKLQAALARLG